MVGIFAGMDDQVDGYLGTSPLGESPSPRYRSLATLLSLAAKPLTLDGNLADRLYAQAISNWERLDAPHRGRSSLQNWRATKVTTPFTPYRSPTSLLNSAITFATGGQLANCIPVDSDLLGSTGRRKVALAEHRESMCSLIELATTANTPLAMAIHGLQHAIAYLFFRSRLTEVGHIDWFTQGPPDLLKADRLSFAVLAPRDFYNRFRRSLDWLAAFEASLNRDLMQSKVCRETQLPVAFHFESFPDDFDWVTSMGESSTGQADVLAAFTSRYRLFAP